MEGPIRRDQHRHVQHGARGSQTTNLPPPRRLVGMSEGTHEPGTEQALAVVSAFAEAWNRHDMIAFADLFAHDAEFVNVVGIWWKGKEAIRSAHAFTHSSMFKRSRMTFLSTEVRFPVEELAIVRSRWTLEGHVSPDGAALPQRSGILLNVLQMSSRSWNIIDSQNTDIVGGVHHGLIGEHQDPSQPQPTRDGHQGSCVVRRSVPLPVC
jgi:uncharacterized protein (TIGR02246 family)